MKFHWIVLGAVIMVVGCGGTWVGDVTGMYKCDSETVEDLKKQIKSGEFNMIDRAFLNGTCGNVGKVFAGDVRCGSAGAIEVKCK